MGLFTGIEEATSSAGGNYIKPGRHLFKIVALKAKMSRKKKSLAIAELEVLESTSHEVGESVSWMANLTDHDAAIGNVKGLLAAIGEITEEDVDEAGADRAFSSENPFEDQKVACDAFMVKTKANNDFTKCLWKPACEWKGLATEKVEAASEPNPEDDIPF